ncbi:hypothetical protein N7478_007161 [Penicillium angulare]|uniref:uncharacterized protein n=1 Tax=Penicillium angulare TaxID=116970 RepID=UPI002541BBB3|nr:uncharacterized protein N7478_007161 [Penicillium angulare]KAJ5281789.1 hypothetical protein N7478_007161 [Penicillium angulare]
MCPDINSLPPSRSSSSSSSLPYRNLPPSSPGTAPAPTNPSNTTTISPRPSRGSSAGRLSVSGRRQSAAGMNTHQNEGPAATTPGSHGEGPWSEHRSSIGHAFRTASPTSHGGSPVFATADPHHQRAPSLGELHQELEQEQEAQVNRLLQLIRSQQAQLHQYQQSHPGTSTAIVDEPSSASERSPSFSLPMPPPIAPSRLSISSVSNRRSSRPSSQATSPSLPPQDSLRSMGVDGTEAFPTLRDTSRRGSRDESSYYQAEASMLSRENQMLRQRVRELERQIGDLTTSRVSASPGTTPAPTTGEASGPGQEGAETETVDPPTAEERSADRKE